VRGGPPSGRVAPARADGPVDRLDLVLVAAVSIGFALPLALARYAPGGDTPWHAAVVAVMADPDPARFLGAYEVDPGAGVGSYVALYRLLGLAARAIGAPAAIQLLCIASVVGMVWAARSLARSFAADGALAILAAPAAYSTTLEFGFVIYLPTFALTLWLWALVRVVMQRGARPWRVIALAASWLGVSLCHPFAALVAGLGAALLWLCELSRERARRAALVAAVLAAGALPAALAIGAVGTSGGSRIAAGASLWDRLNLQVFVPPLESIASAPVQLIGFVDPAWRYGLVALLAAVAVAWRVLAPRPSPAGHDAAAPAVDGPSASRRAGLYLFLLLAALYLVTPFTFEWPRNWYGAQPRLVPLVWVVGLVALRPVRVGWARVAALAVSTAALAALALGALGPRAAEARDLAAVLARSAPSARTLGLIEQRAAVDREPPDSFRSATGWVVAERGGFASHLPIDESGGLNSGQHIPVRRAAGAPPMPLAPPIWRPHAFDWARHAAGWTQFLIRDLDPAHPRDYFAGHASEVVPVARAGRWRLFRRVE